MTLCRSSGRKHTQANQPAVARQNSIPLGSSLCAREERVRADVCALRRLPMRFKVRRIRVRFVCTPVWRICCLCVHACVCVYMLLCALRAAECVLCFERAYNVLRSVRARAAARRSLRADDSFGNIVQNT